MYNMEHVSSTEEQMEFKSRGFMNITANYLDNSLNYKTILSIQTWLIPCHQLVNLLYRQV